MLTCKKVSSYITFYLLLGNIQSALHFIYSDMFIWSISLGSIHPLVYTAEWTEATWSVRYCSSFENAATCFEPRSSIQPSIAIHHTSSSQIHDCTQLNRTVRNPAGINTHTRTHARTHERTHTKMAVTVDTSQLHNGSTSKTKSYVLQTLSLYKLSCLLTTCKIRSYDSTYRHYYKGVF